VFYHPVDPPPAAHDDVAGNKRHFNRAYAIAFVLVAQLLLAALLDAFLPDARTGAQDRPTPTLWGWPVSG
jgi:hypothetical protein